MIANAVPTTLMSNAGV